MQILQLHRIYYKGRKSCSKIVRMFSIYLKHRCDIPVQVQLESVHSHSYTYKNAKIERQ